MKANKVWLFSDLIEKNKRVFKVPVYQRNYDWTNVQCEKLYSDIIKAWKDIMHEKLPSDLEKELKNNFL